MAAVTLVWTLAIHLIMLGFSRGFISAEMAVILLYIINVLIILFSIEWFEYLEICSKHLPLKDETEIEYDEEETPLTNQSPNLFIEHWKKVNLHRPQEFPLDRISFLKAKYFPYITDSCFILKNRELKTLVKKANEKIPDDYGEDVHPCKIVRDQLCEVYIGRRSNFYRCRNVTSADEKQTTIRGRMLTYDDDEDEPPRSSLFPRFHMNCKNPDSSDDESSSSQMRKPRRSLWRRVSKMFGLKLTESNNESE